jgi:mRNA-degrading endonuclease RelE of RelBE toxin-antitoxin system
VYVIEFSEETLDELASVRAFEQERILEAIERQLSHQPTAETRNRKMLEGLAPSFEAVPPIWELRVGEYRIFYDVDEDEKKVYVRAIRRKPPHKTTEEIL